MAAACPETRPKEKKISMFCSSSYFSIGDKGFQLNSTTETSSEGLGKFLLVIIGKNCESSKFNYIHGGCKIVKIGTVNQLTALRCTNKIYFKSPYIFNIFII